MLDLRHQGPSSAKIDPRQKSCRETLKKIWVGGRKKAYAKTARLRNVTEKKGRGQRFQANECLTGAALKLHLQLLETSVCENGVIAVSAIFDKTKGRVLVPT